MLEQAEQHDMTWYTEHHIDLEKKAIQRLLYCLIALYCGLKRKKWTQENANRFLFK